MRVTRCSTDEKLRPTLQPDLCVQRASSKWLQTATLSHPITCEEALRFAQFWSGTPEIKSQGFLKDWQKHLMKEAFIVILTTGAQYNA